MQSNLLYAVLLAICLANACNRTDTADSIIVNARVYTVDTDLPMAEAVAVKDGKILYVGSNEDIEYYKGSTTEVIDANGQFVMPGLIEGHGHFGGLGNSLQNLYFLDARSWQEVVDAVAVRAREVEKGVWITGRGWHQEKWRDTLMQNVLGYPYNTALNEAAPDNPVMLEHASGHGLIANQRAMELAGITNETPDPSGGHIVRDNSGRAIGVFEENATALIEDVYDAYLTTLSEEELEKQWFDGIALAEQECLENGITSFQDAGSSLIEILRYRDMARKGELDMRLWAMVRHEYDFLRDKAGQLPILDEGDGFFTCRAVKLSIDGALGSYGAWLLKPYSDNPGFYGQNTKSIEEMDKLAGFCAENKLQFCVHAIGDRANREVLDAFARAFEKYPDLNSDSRWRIEHAQHLHPDDIGRFAAMKVIPSMQGIHCTSDAPFVEKRLGAERAENGAYVWQSLLQTGALVTNGTDTPVEDINPFESLYATVTRRRIGEKEAFYPEQAMTREQAIYSYTMANAIAAFEEDVKGSLTPGKYADVVMLSNNLLSCPEDSIPKTRVLLTMVNGQVKYRPE